MLYPALKIFLSALIIFIISEASKRSVLVGSLTASLPLVSILAFCWIFYETKDLEKISSLSYGIFWLVIPSLVLFLALPWFLKQGFGFYLSLLCSSAVMLGCYFLMLRVLERFGVEI